MINALKREAKCLVIFGASLSINIIAARSAKKL
nr:MAG TPA: hypothetical protein [Caudoviricetes sp.]